MLQGQVQTPRRQHGETRVCISTCGTGRAADPIRDPVARLAACPHDTFLICTIEFAIIEQSSHYDDTFPSSTPRSARSGMLAALRNVKCIANVPQE